MSDFNRRGTPINKVMSYSRYHMKKIFTTLDCDREINFNVYFRLNINTGSFFATFITLTNIQQKEILKKFISNIYNVSLDKIIIENIIISSIEFKATILNVSVDTETKEYSYPQV